MAIKRGVSFYSYQQAQFFGEMDWKDMCKELHDNLHCDGVEIINIPLINYLLMLKSDLYASMDSQEFLDRESEWSMIFFLSPNLEWIKTYIKINDWTVRINDIRQ